MTYHNPLPDDLKRDWRIVTIAQDFLPDEFRKDYTESDKIMMALDAQPTLVSQSNSAIPFMATTYVDPETIRILQTPNKGAEIIGEKKLGDWNTTTVMFERVENTGRVVAYGDYNDDGNTNVNVDFPQRQAFKFQTIVEYGDDAAERAALAKLNFVAEMKNSAIIVMEKFRNQTYHYGVAGLQLYGTVNDPGLSPAITPSTKQAGGTKWVNNGIVVASPNEIMVDIQALVAQLLTQAPGYIDNDGDFTLVGPPILSLAMTATNSFGLTAIKMIKESFPNIKILTDPLYATPAGNLIQLWSDKFDGHDTGFCGFGEKLREFPVVRELSASKQKVAGTTLGAIVRYGLGVSQMLGGLSMAGSMVVGCKLPHGLVLRLQVKTVQKVSNGATVYDVELWGFDSSEGAETHTLKGFARPAAQVPDAKIIGAHRATDGGTIGGYAISYVPKDFWDKWAAQNKDFPPLKNGTIVAWEKQDQVEGYARERIDVMSGFEPLNPNKLPRGIAQATAS